MAGVISRKKARIEKEAVHISEDVLVEILKILPLKSLLRFSCACKTWYSLISDPLFCYKLHQKRPCMLFCEGSNSYSTVTIESLMNEETSTRSAPIFFPWQPPKGRFHCILGSCKGLVCVEDRTSDNLRGLLLWNPSTRKTKRLPYFNPNPCKRTSSTSPVFCKENICAGFGYDESVDDYKFVWMVLNGKIGFHVFSLKSNTWTSYDYCTSSDLILYGMEKTSWHSTGLLFNGAIHWVVRYADQSSNGIRILALDIPSYKYILLESPPECGWSTYSLVSLVILSGCLCLCIRGSFHIHLWMMKEYGVHSSWLKLVSFRINLGGFHFNTFDPVLFSNEERNIVAMVGHTSLQLRPMYEIMRFRVEKGTIVSSEFLVDSYANNPRFDTQNFALLPIEETLVSLD